MTHYKKIYSGSDAVETESEADDNGMIISAPSSLALYLPILRLWLAGLFSEDTNQTQTKTATIAHARK